MDQEIELGSVLISILQDALEEAENACIKVAKNYFDRFSLQLMKEDRAFAVGRVDGIHKVITKLREEGLL